MIKCCVLSDETGCGYWRLTSPFHYMINNPVRTEKEIAVCLEVNEVGTPLLWQADVIVVTRLWDQKAFNSISFLKKNGKKIIYDIDDDLWSIPTTNPAHHLYNTPRLKGCEDIMNMADVVTTTNEYLAKKLPTNTPVKVIPNAIYLPSYNKAQNKSDDGNKRILWMGSDSHEADMELVIPALLEVLKKDERVKITLVGGLPKCLHEEMQKQPERMEFNNFVRPVEKYIEMTKRIAVDVAICPLADHEFNYSKSILKWLEYTAMHVPTVSSPVGPYKQSIKHNKNGLFADSKKEWVGGITRLLGTPKTAKRIVKQARHDVQRDFSLIDTSEMWRDLVWRLGTGCAGPSI